MKSYFFFDFIAAGNQKSYQFMMDVIVCGKHTSLEILNFITGNQISHISKIHARFKPLIENASLEVLLSSQDLIVSSTYIIFN